VQALQTKLSEYQQKIAVALKIDNDKNEAIEEMAIEKAKFINTLQKYEQQIIQLQKQIHFETTANQNGLLQSKLAEALAINEKLQEKNHYLEQKMESNIM
jgi:centrobin